MRAPGKSADPAIRECGALREGKGTRFRVWAPGAGQVRAEIGNEREKTLRVLDLSKDSEGYHEAFDPDGRVGERYRFLLDGRGPFPDPASRAQAGGVHGASLVVDPAHEWTDASWRRPPFRDLVIYELHVGAFTPEGTFASALARLPELRDLGINAVELMPIADFPGNRNWGYDGVLLYAPASCYGPPADLRRLVNAAHGLGIAVLLDVVYNHLGPDGNYLGQFSPDYFTDRHHTPWGKALNFDGPNSRPVRDFFLGNIRYWMRDFHIDGFRLDATHEIPDDSQPHILAEIAAMVRAEGAYVIAEDPRNEARLLEPPASGGFGLNAVWADDFHHVMRVAFTKENASYYGDFRGDVEEQIRVLRDGWLYTGQYSPAMKMMRGTPGSHLRPEQFIHCISNHDQIGNRAFGERLNHLVSPAAYRALSALLCFSPYTPLLFMGQEWGTSAPFLFFTDHHDELGQAITRGRRREFAGFAEFATPAARTRIPDPQAQSTFEQSKLKWEEAEHSPIRSLYQTALGLRRELSSLRPPGREGWKVTRSNQGIGVILYEQPARPLAVIFELGSPHSLDLSREPAFQESSSRQWRCRFSSQEKRFGGFRDTLKGERFDFPEPEVMLLERV